MGLYLGLDLGTSWLKAVIIDEEGRIAAKAAREIQISQPSPGYAEEFPSHWWNTFCVLLQSLSLQVDLSKIHAVGLSGQMHGTVCYNKKLETIAPAVIWTDKRSASQVEQINRTVGKTEIYKITGNPVFTGLMLPTLLWLKQNEPETYKRINKVSSPKDFIALRLTGNLFCEPTDALATGCFDYSNSAWSKKLLDIFSLNPGIFPDLIDTTSPYGTVTKEAAETTGLPHGIPVYGGSDQSMAAIGSGIIEEGSGLLSVSTGGQFFVVTKSRPLDSKGRLHTLNHAIKNITISMSATLSAGLSLQWFKTNIMQQLDSSYDSFIKDIETVPAGSDGLFFMPYLAGERTPYFNPELKSAFIGQTLNHNRLHFIRAIMEGVAYSFRDGLEVFKENNICPESIILSGGGAKNPLWCRIICDILDIPVKTSGATAHSPFGAALFAKFASSNKLNTLPGLNALRDFYKTTAKITHRLHPSPENRKIYENGFKSYKKHAAYLSSMQ